MNTGYLFAANVAVWLGVAGYLVFLASRQAALSKRIRQTEILGDDGGK
jgi:CcmD family protein